MNNRYFFTALVTAIIMVPAVLTSSVMGAGPPEYLPGKIIVKVEDEQAFFRDMQENGSAQNRSTPGDADHNASGAGQFADSPSAAVQQHMQAHGLSDMKPVFRPGAYEQVTRLKRPGSQPDRLQELASGFERTFRISYSSEEDPRILAEKVEDLPGVVYAEPHYVHETTQQRVFPNDPLIGEEGHDFFGYQNFNRAWGVSTGSSDVVISIVDSGVYYDHPDLKNKLWHNPEPGRASDVFPEIQNDTIGWNFWESGDVFAGEEPEQNADPAGNFSTHGTHVAGIAAADTDNNEGIAGTGFDSSFMPVKTGGTKQYPNSIAYGYHGILYSAINEADVINCSFGGIHFSQFGKDVIEFAIASGSVVVAAAGNNGKDVLFYPAAHDDVLTVGSVNRHQDDEISTFSNYGYYLDVFAMGERLISTFFSYDEEENSWTPRYQSNTGTSMAAPVVSGLAALIKADNPDWSPQRIATQIRATANSIEPANPNQIYRNKLGKGLIDAYAAIDDIKPGLRITDHTFKKEDNGKINMGESGELILSGINHGMATSGIQIDLEVMQEHITIEPESVNSGPVSTGETFQVTFDIDITDDYQPDEIPLFRLDLTDDAAGYSDFYMFEYERLLFDIIDINTIATSIASDGTIGFKDALSAHGGIGFIPGEYGNVLFEGGLMITAVMDDLQTDRPDPVVINQVRETTNINRDFLPVRNFRLRQPGEVSDIDGEAVFESSRHRSANELTVEMNTYAYNSSDLDQAVLVTYKITNNSMKTFRDMHVGLFNDWDIRDPGNNNTRYSEQDSLIYAYHPSGAPYVAAGHLGAVSSAFAIDNTSSMSLPVAQTREDSLRFGIYYRPDNERYDGFTDDEKRLSLTAGTERTTISGTDISIVTATGPFTLMPLASINAGFVYAWGEDYSDLLSQVTSARNLESFKFSTPGEYYGRDDIADRTTIYQNFPNPFNTSTVIEFHLAEPTHVELAVYDVLGRKITTLVDDFIDNRVHFVPFDAMNLASGVYIAVLRTEERTETMTMSLVK